MELKKSIELRRSIRRYKNRMVEEDKILEILNAARLAPSAKNRQPWMFYIAQGEIKDKIANLMKSWHEDNKNNGTSLLDTSIAIEQAPVLILVFRKSESQWERSDTLSIGGAIENMLLTATNLGLGSLWIADTYYIKNEISKLINTDLELYSAVSIGYANEFPEQRPRKSLNELILS